MHFASLKATLVEFLKAQAQGHIEKNNVTESVSMGQSKSLDMFNTKKRRSHPNQPEERARLLIAFSAGCMLLFQNLRKTQLSVLSLDIM